MSRNEKSNCSFTRRSRTKSGRRFRKRTLSESEGDESEINGAPEKRARQEPNTKDITIAASTSTSPLPQQAQVAGTSADRSAAPSSSGQTSVFRAFRQMIVS